MHIQKQSPNNSHAKENTAFVYFFIYLKSSDLFTGEHTKPIKFCYVLLKKC